MADGSILLSEDDFDRISQSVRYTERLMRGESPPDDKPLKGRQPCTIKITGAKDEDTGLYPAVYTNKVLATGLWKERTVCRAFPLNDETVLVTGKRYHGLLVSTTQETVDSVASTFGVVSVHDTASSKPSSDCSAWLQYSPCATLAVTEGLGSCACVVGQEMDLAAYGETLQPVDLADPDVLYGCPPGVTTTYCPSGAPRKRNIVVTGFTGGSTGFNGNYTVTFTTGGTFVGTRSGVTATLVQTSIGSYTLTLDDGVNAPTWTVTGVTGCCGTLTLTLADSDGTTTAPSSLSATPATSCGKGPSYTPYLDFDKTGNIIRPRMLWKPTAGSGSKSILFDEGKCGVDGSGHQYIEFSTSDILLCTATATECGPNRITVRVTCKKCSICSCTSPITWTTPGFYCTLGNGCVFYDGDPGPDVSLCFGPFTTQEDCENSITIPGCECSDQPAKLPRRMCLSVELISGTDIAGLNGFKSIIEYGVSTTTIGAHRTWGNLADGPLLNGFYIKDAGVWINDVEECNTFTAVIGLGGDADCSISAFFLADIGGGPDAHAVACVLDGGDPVEATMAGSAVCGSSDPPTYRFTLTPSDADCVSSTIPVTYICVDGTCTPVYDSSGTSIAECVAICGSETPSGGCSDLSTHPDLDVTLTKSGSCPDAALLGDQGDYTAVWNGTNSRWEFTGSHSGITWWVYYDTVLEEYRIDNDSGSFQAPLGGSCDPLYLTYEADGCKVEVVLA